MPIKTFRGLITTDGGGDGPEEIVPLHTNDGSIGYQIVKFQIIPKDPTDVGNEIIVQIFSVPTASTDEIDFSNPTLLAAAHYSNAVAGQTNPEDATIIFDNEIFNQDIYIVAKSDGSDRHINYYIELEQRKLDLNENTVATLRDIRNLA
jgi:hypothetical protein